MIFTVFFTDNGVPKTGLSPIIDIWAADGTHIINNQAMIEIAGGFYKYDFAAYDATLDYVIRADSITLSGHERYAYASNEHKGELDILQALIGKNYRLKSVTRDSMGNMTTGTVVGYANAADTENDTNAIITLAVTGEVTDGRLTGALQKEA